MLATPSADRPKGPSTARRRQIREGVVSSSPSRFLFLARLSRYSSRLRGGCYDGALQRHPAILPARVLGPRAPSLAGRQCVALCSVWERKQTETDRPRLRKFTLTTDLFPKNLIGSAMGFGGAAGAIGGMFIATFAGYILQVTGSYVPLFIVAGTAYLVGLFLIHLLSPRLNPVAGYDERPGID